MLSTPILFLIFNRPDTTATVFKEIRKQKPKYLFVAADGPRVDKPDDAEKCRKSRELVMNGIDWDCDFKTLFREKNLGCGLAVSSAITWFFSHVEEGIILEDDTIPDISFFPFCKELLERYRDNEMVKMISGNNFQFGKRRGNASYYFSAYGHIWGWASWRRAWKEYDYSLKDINEDEIRVSLNLYFKKKSVIDYWVDIFKVCKKDQFDTWDFQWTFSIWKQGGISILPILNLVTNIGFGKDATHTKDANSQFMKMKVESLTCIEHPEVIELDSKADKFTFDVLFKNRDSIVRKIKRKIRRIIYG